MNSVPSIWWQWTRSLRWRIQAWYAAILIVSLVSFGAMLYWESARAIWNDVDNDLFIGLRLLDGSMRFPPPPPFIDGNRDRFQRRGPPMNNGIGPFMNNGNGPPFNGNERWDGRGEPFDGMRGPRRGPDGGIPPRDLPNVPPEFLFGPMTTPLFDQPFLAEMGDFRPMHNVDGGMFERTAPPRLLNPTHPSYRVVWTHDGFVLHQSGAIEDAPSWHDVMPLTDIRPNRIAQRTRGSNREVLTRGLDDTILCVGMDVKPEQDRIRRFSWILGMTGFAVSLIGLAGGAWSLQKTLRPMLAMQKTAERIRSDNLQQRFDVGAMDQELSQFASAINAMLDRLESGFEQQRQFTADASHELRTPLAILLSSTELALSRNRSADVYKAELEKCQRAAQRMRSLVDALLTLSRLDASGQSLPMSEVAFDQICLEQVELHRELAKDHSISLEVDLVPCVLTGHGGILERLVANLLLNAIIYNHEGGRVHVALKRLDDSALLEITDTGIGIPEDEQPHLFKRFYRVDKARSRQTGGSGLGLAICELVAQLHRGTIEVDSHVGQGSRFRVKLPLRTVAESHRSGEDSLSPMASSSSSSSSS